MNINGSLVTIAGTIKGYTREELELALRERGATVSDALSMESAIVLAGQGSERVADQARELGVRVIQESDVKNLLAGKPIAAPAMDDAWYGAAPASDVPEHIIYEEAYAMPPEDGFTAAGSSPRKKTSPSPAKAADGSRVFGKGDTVKIIGGREGVGEIGRIFWWGDSKYGEGMRAGVATEDEEKYWVDEADLGWPDDEVPEEVIKQAEAASHFKRGDTVRVIAGKDEGAMGTIFWWGDSRFGEGMRAGIETPDGDKVWADAEHLAKGDAGDIPAAGPAKKSTAPVMFEDDDIPF